MGFSPRRIAGLGPEGCWLTCLHLLTSCVKIVFMNVTGITATPIFTHDCENCTYLGTMGSHDLYHCSQGGMLPTVIERFGNLEESYNSGMAFAELGIEPYVTARNLAILRGLEV